MLFYKMSGYDEMNRDEMNIDNEKVSSEINWSEIHKSNIKEGPRIPIPNRTIFDPKYDTSGFSIDYLTNRNIDQVIDRSLTICPLNEANDIRSANAEAKKMISMDVDELYFILKASFNSNSGGGKKKKGGSFTLFLPLAILLAKDTNNAIRAMSKLGEDYIYSWFDYMNTLTGCLKDIYDKAMYDIYPSLIKMYNEGRVNEVAPFIINNVPIYFNYVIQKLSEVEETITDVIVKKKAEVLKNQYLELKSRFVKGNEDYIATNAIIEERLREAGRLKTEIDRQKIENKKKVDEEQKLAEVEELITQLKKEKLENTQATINAVLQAKNDQKAQKILQNETIELGEMLLHDPIFLQANHYKRKNKEVTKSSQPKSVGSKYKPDETKTIRGRQVPRPNRGGGKRNTKKHYNKKKKTKKHAKKLHRKTKRG